MSTRQREDRELAKFKTTTLINPFNYSGVQLNDSMFDAQFDTMKKYYLGIPNDNIIKGFRERIGLDAPGRDLGGYYTGKA